MLRRLPSSLGRASAGYLALLVFAWGITLAPILHSLHHQADHEHIGDALILTGSELVGHYHADGSWHAGASLPDTPPTPGADPARTGNHLRGALPVAPGAHAHGSLAHFGTLFQSIAPLLLPLRPGEADLVAPPVLVSRQVPASIWEIPSPRGPPG